MELTTGFINPLEDLAHNVDAVHRQIADEEMALMTNEERLDRMESLLLMRLVNGLETNNISVPEMQIAAKLIMENRAIKREEQKRSEEMSSLASRGEVEDMNAEMIRAKRLERMNHEEGE